MQPINQVERIILDQVKFLNIILQEARKRNEFLRENLDMSYAKLIGLGTPYEECVHSLRKVKAEFDQYLTAIREKMLEEERKNQQGRPRRREGFRP